MTMNYRIFALRLIISIVIAVVISFFFFDGIRPFKTSLLALILFALAYLFEYTKKRDKKEGKGAND